MFGCICRLLVQKKFILTLSTSYFPAAHRSGYETPPMGGRVSIGCSSSSPPPFSKTSAFPLVEPRDRHRACAEGVSRDFFPARS